MVKGILWFLYVALLALWGLIFGITFLALWALPFYLMTFEPLPPKPPTPTPAISVDEDDRYDENCGRTGCYGSE